MNIRSYSELLQFPSFEGRYDYLRIGGRVGVETFGHSRYINQRFYTSSVWRSTREEVIIRDRGCDLGIDDRQINDRIYIHHMNPVTEEDVDSLSDFLLDPEFLICVSFNTHNAIHFGDESLLSVLPIERTRYDTSPWLLHRRH